MNKTIPKIFIFILLLNLMSCKSYKDMVDDAVNEANKHKVVHKKKGPSPIQKKYAAILDVEPEQVKNIKLYSFIDKWMDTPYKMGGENKQGIDCSFFSQHLYHEVYDHLIERTAQRQFKAKNTNRFLGQEFLEEGDLLFFNLEGSYAYMITHVGIYLGNDKFVHSTARKSNSGKNGVQISTLSSNHWQKLFVAAGRKPLIDKITDTDN